MANAATGQAGSLPAEGIQAEINFFPTQSYMVGEEGESGIFLVFLINITIMRPLLLHICRYRRPGVSRNSKQLL